MRKPRHTNCPSCGTDIIIENSRSGATRRKYCDTCKSHSRFSQYKQQIHKHNISIKDLDFWYSIDECECCGIPIEDGKGPGKNNSFTRQLDHCHKTGIIRGVLCWACNAGIGKLGDNLEGVMNAVDYLNKRKE